MRTRTFGVLPFWPWNMEMLAYAYATADQQAPLLEDAPLGGLQLDVQPWRAQVYADGVLVGTVDDFKGYYQHLELPAGPHFVEIVAPDYEPLSVDIVIIPGRTMTYRGTLTRALTR